MWVVLQQIHSSKNLLQIYYNYLDSALKSEISRPLFNIVPIHKVLSRCFHAQIISLCYQQRPSCVSDAVSRYYCAPRLLSSPGIAYKCFCFCSVYLTTLSILFYYCIYSVIFCKWMCVYILVSISMIDHWPQEHIRCDNYHLWSPSIFMGWL